MSTRFDQFSIKQITQTYEAAIELQRLVNTDLTLIKHTAGICGNICSIGTKKFIFDWCSTRSTNIICHTLVDWDLYSNNFSYPIPTETPDNFSGFTDHLFSDTLWVGEQLEYRRQAIDHIVSTLERVLAERLSDKTEQSISFKRNYIWI